MGAFPPSFLWGVATSSLQIEGSLDAHGAGLASWVGFADQPGRVAGGDSPRGGCDHFRRWREDIALMKDLGVRAYRFSVAWPRVFPEGDGPPAPRGFDFYDELIDALLAAGIEPFLTLYHWETPETVERDWGGWRSARTVDALARFAGHVARRAGDRVRHFITVNEIPCFTEYAYGPGAVHPPALTDCDDATRERAMFHGGLAHARMALAVRAASPRPARIGFADNPHGFVPLTSAPEHVAAARTAMRMENARIATLLMEGAWPEAWLAARGGPPVDAAPDEMADIRAGRPDFFGLNLYSGHHVAADAAAPFGYRLLDYPAGYPRLAMPWLQLEPSSLYWSVRFLSELWAPEMIYITENGCACETDLRDEHGRVVDTDRILYLREHLAWAERACAEGYPLRGYFHWTLLDNFEWRHGYGKRFGLVEAEPGTYARRPKWSAAFYRDVIADNAVVAAATEERPA